MEHMKMSKKGKESSEVAECEECEYPYGLNISLEDESLEKLGIKELPEVGTKFTLTAEVSVVSVNASASEGEDDRRSVRLQITDMELGVKAKDIGKELYG